MKSDWFVAPGDANRCGSFMSERHRHASGFSESHRRTVKVVMVNRNMFRVEELDLGVAPDAARRTDIGDINNHLARTGESVGIARQDHQLVAGAWWRQWRRRGGGRRHRGQDHEEKTHNCKKSDESHKWMLSPCIAQF
jgi:hypothetical protein